MGCSGGPRCSSGREEIWKEREGRPGEGGTAVPSWDAAQQGVSAVPAPQDRPWHGAKGPEPCRDHRGKPGPQTVPLEPLSVPLHPTGEFAASPPPGRSPGPVPAAGAGERCPGCCRWGPWAPPCSSTAPGTGAGGLGPPRSPAPVPSVRGTAGTATKPAPGWIPAAQSWETPAWCCPPRVQPCWEHVQAKQGLLFLPSPQILLHPSPGGLSWEREDGQGSFPVTHGRGGSWPEAKAGG